MSQSLTSQLAQLVLERKITGEDRDKARLFVADTFACLLAAVNTPQGKIVREWYAASGRDAGRTAFLLGALSHTLEVDDLHRASVTHPGCVVIPAAWAMAMHTRSPFGAVLDAIIRGYETMCRIGTSVGPSHYEIWHNTATCGPFGAAMAAGVLLGLDQRQIVDALGNAGTQASGLWEFLPAGAMSKHLHAGRAAESGIIAAELAQRGFTGPDTILEGEQGFYKATCPDPDIAALLQGPDDPWLIHDTSMKPWPSCRHTHPAIDAALSIELPGGPDEVTAVSVSTYGAALNLCNRPNPDTTYDAKFSLQHCVAAALADHSLSLDSFESAARQSYARLRGKVTLKLDQAYEDRYPHDWGSQVCVKLRSGETLIADRTSAKGDPDQPLGPQEIRKKGAALLDHANLERLEPYFAGLLTLPDEQSTPDLPDQLYAS